MADKTFGDNLSKSRKKAGLSQEELAEKMGLTRQTISKWETARGLPDISLLQPLSQALGVSLPELMNGEHIINRNTCANLLRSKFYVCPLCGNILHSTGDALISCCGLQLPPLEAEEMDEEHSITVETGEHEHFISICHPMTKEHFISFLAFITCDRVQLVKFYPEGNAEARMQLRGRGTLYFYCNHHGLFRMKR